jgi:hypothetical protein
LGVDAALLAVKNASETPHEEKLLARKMSQAHKDALAKGREQGRVVRDYLAALEVGKKPGRKVDESSIRKRIKDVQKQIDAEADPGRRVTLIQKRLDLENRLVTMHDEPDFAALEKAFVDAASDYSDRRGISYTAWREAGVPAEVLRRAGVPRTRRKVVE